MKFLFALLVLVPLAASAQNPYLKLDYDSLVIYDYGFEMRADESNIKKTGKNYSLINKPAKSVKLSHVEAKEFTTKIGEDSTYAQYSADCFNPHFAAFYYKKGKAIANVEICIGCNRLYPSIEIPAKFARPEKIEGGETFYPHSGLSRNFRLYMKVLLDKYGFSHAPTGQSVFDKDY
jgi:hypothetical protein